MDNKARIECPKCGRPLQKFNGHIGYCSQHKWVSPAGLGFEAEAAEQNRLDAAKAEQSRLEQERQKAEAEAQERREEHQRTIRKVIAVVVALAVIAAGVTYYIVRPSLNYSSATEKFTAGEYEEARTGYAALGNYKDAAARVILCDAMMDLQEGNTEAAAEKLDQLINAGQTGASEQLAKALSTIVSNWKANGLTPQALLMLLDKIEQIDPNGELDALTLTVEGHTALLDDSVRSSYAEDIDGNGEYELIVLNDDYTVTVYRMTSDGNTRLSMSDEKLAACAIRFGKNYENTDISAAIACYIEAHRLLPNEDTLSTLSAALHAAISTWEDKQVPASDVPALIYMADTYGIDLSDIDWDSAYKKAALLTAGETVQHDFVDWNQDGYPELLTIDAAGKLSLYAVGETWGVVSEIDTAFSNGKYTIEDETAPLILAISSNQDGFVAITGSSLGLHILFEERGIHGYRQTGSDITFSKQLDGSIVRSAEYRYTAHGTENRPLRTGIDWQQSSYPMPRSAESVSLRYWEARTYEIAEEAALLIGEPQRADIFSLETLARLPKPDSVGSIEISAYQTADDRVLFEVSYQANVQTVRAWVSTEYSDGWKVTGAADTYGAGLDGKAMDTSIPLLSLNAEAVHTISEKNGRVTYRVLVPTAGRLALKWQSGSKETSRTAYTVSMQRGTLTGETVFTYDLQPSPKLQQSRDLFVPAGVYYVTVETKVADAEEYRLTLSLSEETNVELENNDTAQNATSVALNTPYSASLSSARDVDFFSFTLEEASAVNVTLNTSGSGSKSTLYTYEVYSATDGPKLAGVSIPGNAQLSETGNLYLAAGSYYVQVAKGSSSTNEEYILTVHVDQGGFMEAESNDTQETANAVPVNEDIHGSFSREGDVDFFAFTLDSDAVIQPRFTFTPTDSSSKTYVLTILDNSRRELLKVNIGGKESTKVIAPLALPAGTYTVKLENPRFVRQDYTLRLVSMAVEASEHEPNDSAGLATELNIGQARTGVLSSNADVDYYKLSFAQQTTVTFHFSFTQSTSTSTAFVLSIEQNGKNQWSTNIKGDSGGIEQTLQFPAGEYYLKVKPSTWISAVYTIEIK